MKVHLVLFERQSYLSLMESFYENSLGFNLHVKNVK